MSDRDDAVRKLLKGVGDSTDPGPIPGMESLHERALQNREASKEIFSRYMNQIADVNGVEYLTDRFIEGMNMGMWLQRAHFSPEAAILHSLPDFVMADMSAMMLRELCEVRDVVVANRKGL